MQDAKKSENANLQMAQSLASDQGVSNQPGPGASQSAATASGTTSGTSNRSASSGGTGAVANLTGSGNSSGAGTARTSCTSAPINGSYSGTLACATAADAALPNWASSPQFQDQLQKLTGEGMGQFMGSSNPTGAMGGLGNSMSGADGQKLTAALAPMQAKFMTDDGAGAYASSGGGHGGGGSDAQPDIAGLMAGIMGQMMPKKPDGTSPLTAVESAAQRSPAGMGGLSEDRQVSLFDRVTYRYYKVSPSMLGAQTLPPRN
jgi:hypothetical protein